MTVNRQDNWFDKHRMIVVICVISAFLLVVAFSTMQSNSSSSTNKPVDELTKSEIAYQAASADVMKSVLDIYYILNGYYPVSYDELINDISSNLSDYNETDLTSLGKTHDNLTRFEYSRKGDGQACMFTYINSSNKKITVNIDYKNEYH